MRIGKEMGRHIGLPYGTVTRLPFPFFMLTQSTICTQALAGKGVVHKRVENRSFSKAVSLQLHEKFKGRTKV